MQSAHRHHRGAFCGVAPQQESVSATAQSVVFCAGGSGPKRHRPLHWRGGAALNMGTMAPASLGVSAPPLRMRSIQPPSFRKGGNAGATSNPKAAAGVIAATLVPPPPFAHSLHLAQNTLLAPPQQQRFVPPSVTPVAAPAAVKPSHQVLLVKPLPLNISRDEELLQLAQHFLVPRMPASNTAASTAGNVNTAAYHNNMLPYAAKVVRNTVLSTAAAAQIQNDIRADSEAASSSTQNGATATTTLLPHDVFCEEGYGFLLFATEEAGLAYSRAVQKGRYLLTRPQCGSFVYPAWDGPRQCTDENYYKDSITAIVDEAKREIRNDFNDITAIKNRLYNDAFAAGDQYGLQYTFFKGKRSSAQNRKNQPQELIAEDGDCNDDDDTKSNCSYTSSVSSSSCDSATSFNSMTSNDTDNESADVGQSCEVEKDDVVHPRCDATACEFCKEHRRMYRIYHNAKSNRANVLRSVRVRCPLNYLLDSSRCEDIASQACNGLPPHPSVKLAAFAAYRYVFDTMLSPASIDGTISSDQIHPHQKSLPLKSVAYGVRCRPRRGKPAAGDAPIDSQHQQGAASPPQNPLHHPLSSTAAMDAVVKGLGKVTTQDAAVKIYRPIIIDRSNGQENRKQLWALNPCTSTAAEDGTKVTTFEDTNFYRAAADLMKRNTVTDDTIYRPVVPFPTNHHTHHRHCVLHRSQATAKREAVRKAKAEVRKGTAPRPPQHAPSRVVSIRPHAPCHAAQLPPPPSDLPKPCASPPSSSPPHQHSVSDHTASQHHPTPSLVMANASAVNSMITSHSCLSDIEVPCPQSWHSSACHAPPVTSAMVILPPNPEAPWEGQRYRYNPYHAACKVAPLEVSAAVTAALAPSSSDSHVPVPTSYVSCDTHCGETPQSAEPSRSTAYVCWPSYRSAMWPPSLVATSRSLTNLLPTESALHTIREALSLVKAKRF